jgi:[acyl-carrier-protein] S-malonyltransferase
MHKKIVLMFCGQGSQYIGMGADFLNENKKYESYFEKASDVAGKNILDIIHDRHDSGKLLSQTFYSQLSIYALSSCLYDHLITDMGIKREKIMTVTGHSLGDYGAITAAGYIGFEDCLKLVSCRADLMTHAKEGLMAAVLGLDIKEVEDAISTYAGKVFIANYNDYTQIVISGERQAVTDSMQALKDAGAKRVLPLPISIASHCPLMYEASLKLEKYINDRVVFKDPSIPFYSSVKGSTVQKEEMKEVLTAQLVNRINWVHTIEHFLREGANVFIEVGPAKVLSALTKRLALKNAKSDINIFSTDKMSDLQGIYEYLSGEGVV